MKLRIIHKTEYEFSSKVFFEPHFFRFKPKTTPHLQLETFNLDVSPVPVGISENTDAENNLINLCWFEGMHEKMLITSEIKVNSQEYNPFNFILYPGDYLNLPFQYSKDLWEVLSPAMILEPINASLLEFGQKILAGSNANTVEFLTNLTKQIHSNFTLINREFGSPLEANETFRLKTGSCRDLAWMQIMVLRHMGFASRFVSGYYFLKIQDANFELHAWVEVFLPGAGWIGFDPSHGLFAGNTHIPIASSSKSENTMPVSGIIRGSATSKMETNLYIENVV
ncbi:transglutaminase family protein [Draconibacterium sp.]|nr:transglutaminase family protein [Draconibacterium sp.]